MIPGNEVITGTSGTPLKVQDQYEYIDKTNLFDIFIICIVPYNKETQYLGTNDKYTNQKSSWDNCRHNY